jgi:hypothetical protein
LKNFKDIKSFIIHGFSDIKVIRENDYFLLINPNNLEVEEHNITSAEILYLIENEYSFKRIEEYFNSNYDVNGIDVRLMILNFIRSLNFKNKIINKLLLLEEYSEFYGK